MQKRILENMKSIWFMLEPVMFKKWSEPKQIKENGSLFVTPVSIFEELDVKVELKDVIDFLDSELISVVKWEKTAIEVYRKIRGLEKHIAQIKKEIEPNVTDEVEENPMDYPDLRISTRTTYNFKESPLYVEKYDELKEIEKTLKVATDMKNKWDTYCNENWEVIEPVSIKYAQVLTYTAWKK